MKIFVRATSLLGVLFAFYAFSGAVVSVENVSVKIIAFVTSIITSEYKLTNYKLLAKSPVSFSVRIWRFPYNIQLLSTSGGEFISDLLHEAIPNFRPLFDISQLIGFFFQIVT